MDDANTASLAPSGRIITYIGQYLTVAALLGAALSLVPAIAAPRPITGLFAAGGMPNRIAVIVFAVTLLCFISPTRLDRLLARARFGFLRLMADGFLLAVGLVTVLAWYIVIGMGWSLPLRYVSATAILPLAAVWIPTFIYSFLAPAAVFGRSEGFSRADQEWINSGATIPVHYAQSDSIEAETRRGGFLSRALGFVLLAGTVVPGVYFYGWPLWLPSPELAALIEPNRTLITWGAAFLAGFGGLLFAGKSYDAPVTRTAQKIITAGAAATLMYFVGASGLMLAAPYAASHVSPAAPASALVTVVEKADGKSRRGCGNAATVYLEGATGSHWKICNIPDTIWTGIGPGDRLLLSGPGTRDGIRYDSITLAP
ncbi:MAG: hypothetical protein ACRCS0_14505 [Albidovulum sp.]